MGEWLGMLALIALGAYWLDSHRVRDLALNAAKRFCEQQGLQLLDETVAASALSLRRNARGHMVIARLYRFEFSDTGDNRLVGTLLMLGKQIGPMHLPDYQNGI